LVVDAPETEFDKRGVNRISDEAGNVIEMHEHTGKFNEP
jgi:hypothetical protein